jgi:hypothetical protein
MSRDGKVVDEKKGTGALAPGQGWNGARKREVVTRVPRGALLDQLSRQLGVELARLECWRERAMSTMDEGLREQGDSPVEREFEEAKARIDEFSMENELSWKRVEKEHPFPRRRSHR